MPSRTSEQRHQANIESVRRLVDSRSPSVVRDAMVGSAISGSRRKYPLPSIGYRSGKLTVTGYIAGVRKGVKALIVQCDCNEAEYMVEHHNFKNFKSTRCNLCAKAASSAKRYWMYSNAMEDDEHRTRLLNRPASAIARCHSTTNRAYQHYGERGIYVCAEWRADRAAFLQYVQTLDGWEKPDLEMDRIDVDKGYEPGNIRFVSRSDNLRNKRKIADLEARIRHLELRLSQQIHHTN
jgi:hypothetical protein